ncbi:hypothetical protein Y900_024330 [Mycolicibacterium aromaticivorans JS19b1 = JCM 16368]|uniref:Uncharacterized protein n=1 Tax=Mycolicibacterium aromaticivorans JS19b1 = JCM 16368 TaxID=1440774 RepID=A0A064CNN6_9MYCO|nr:hypothetical protein [Mycolicibacterium aromaticivorans]KDF01971.1 hypothetical protein Y900_024330 [Mycolicibacterium aromaticivorans JS19b1 = JCM 16368]
MTTQTASRHWRRAVRGTAIGALAAGLLVGIGTQQALADPSTAPANPTAPATADANGVPQFQSADQLLQFIDQNYDQGAGGGQLSNLIKSVMKLRAQGIKPSRTNIAEIQNALQYRPNQKPLIEALQNTLGYQQKIFAQMQLLQQAQQRQQNNAVMGAGQMPSDGAPTIGGNQAPAAAPPAVSP